MYFYQPDNGTFGELLINEIKKNTYKKYDSLTILVAYAKHSGVARVAETLEAFRAASGRVEVIVGINQQQTTVEALELLRQVSSRVRVFFDEDTNKTFHPKIYWLANRKSKAQWIAVGSNNLTAGGLYLNYEMAVVADPAADTTEGKGAAALITSVAKGVGRTGHLQTINVATIRRLQKNGYILSEQEARARSNAQRSQSAGTTKSTAKPAFPRSPATKLPPVPKKYQLPTAGAGATVKTAAGTIVPASPAPTSGFWKRLSNWDVSLKGSPGQIIIPRELLPYFPALSPLITTTSGAQQADASFAVEFREPGRASVAADDARVIWYVPAAKHKRTNIELRFTFHSRPILLRLQAGDVLEFRPTGTTNPAMVVTRIPAAQVTYTGTYGVIP